jgi:hypothetical protein
MSPVRKKPSARHHLGGLVGALPVAGHHLRAADGDLAGLAGGTSRRPSSSSSFSSVPGSGRPMVP